jgi:PKD repeat protein
MQVWSDDRAVAVQVGAVILFAFLIIAIAGYQASVVPNQNEAIEFNHNQRVQGQLQDVGGAVGSMPATQDSRTVTVDLSTSYPARTIFINPPTPTGRLQTVGTGNETVAFEVQNATATNPDIDDFWDGTTRNYSTGAISYQPNYNVYSQAPVTVVENSLVYNEFADETLRVNSQSLFDGDRISLVALSGSFRGDGGTASVNVRPVSASTTTVPVQATGGDNVTVSIVSRLSPGEWNETIAESREFANQSGYVASIDGKRIGSQGGTRIYRVNFTMVRGQTYDLQLASVGVGELSGGEGTTNASYSVAATDTVTTEENTNTTVTIEVRDQYDNPKSSVTVNATATGSAGGSIADSPRTTNEDGYVTFTYNTTKNVDGASSKTDTVRVSFTGDTTSGFDDDAPENVTTRVTVKNTDGSGTGGGGGGGAYGIEFDDAPSYDWNVTDDGSTITLTASTLPEAIDGVSTDFAVNNSTVTTIDDAASDGETNANGDSNVVLNAKQNGTVAVYVGSSGSSDVINVTVTDVPSNSNSPPSADYTYLPSSPSTADSISFDGTPSSDSDGSISSYSWDFGDGTTATGSSPSHSYGDDGSYTVTLTVTDDDGATDTATKTVTVSNEPPSASFTVTPSSPLVGESTEFDGSGSSDSDGSIAYSWDFGDGTTASGVSPNHTYTSSGTYTVTLTVRDDDGATTTTTRQVTVRSLPKMTAVEPDPDALADSDGEFVRVYFPTATDTTGWTMDDGDTGGTTSLPSETLSGEVYFARNPSAFASQWGIDPAKVYTLDTTLANGGESIELITDRGRVIDEFAYNGPTTSNDWTLLSVDEGEVAVRQTDGSGNYVDTNDSSDWSTTAEESFFGVPVSSFTYSPSKPVAGSSVNFNASGTTDDGTIQTYEWDWDDDGTYEASTSSASHTFTFTGKKTVTLRVTDGDGLTDTTTRTVQVIGGRIGVTYVGKDSGGNNVLRTVDKAGRVTSFDAGPDIVRVGPATSDFDGDGLTELTYITSSGYVELIDRNNETQRLSSVSAKKAGITVGSWQGSSTQVFYANNNDGDAVYRKELGTTGSGTLVASFGTSVKGVLGIGDVDGDGSDEIATITGGNKVGIVDQDGTTYIDKDLTIASSSGPAIGAVADYDNDGFDRIATIDGSNQVRLVECNIKPESDKLHCNGGGNTADETITLTPAAGAKKAPIGAANWTGDGTPEVVYAENANSPAELYYVEVTSGGNVGTEDYVTDTNGNRIEPFVKKGIGHSTALYFVNQDVVSASIDDSVRAVQKFDDGRTIHRHAQIAAATSTRYEKRGYRRGRAVDREPETRSRGNVRGREGQGPGVLHERTRVASVVVPR